MNQNALMLALSILLYASQCLSYEIETHRALSNKAYEKSILRTDRSVLANLGLGTAAVLQVPEGNLSSIVALVERGSEREDDGLRPINHFYDPYHKRALTVPLAHTSPDWALEDVRPISRGMQQFSYWHALDYYQSALAERDEQNRQWYWSTLFESLGHVVHHIQDMAQPQHVRNDAHLDYSVIGDRSLYEDCTNVAILKPGNEAGCGSPLGLTEYGEVTFSKAREFWSTLGSKERRGRGFGLADYTNQNFVSKDTNLPRVDPSESYYPDPKLRPSQTETLEALGASRAAEICQRFRASGRTRAVQDVKCEIEFYASDVYDAYGDLTSLNARASSRSIFDQYLQVRDDDETYAADRIYTLNRFNHSAVHQYLVPRAIAYSAGLINHFFRGRIEVEEVHVEGNGLRIDLRNESSADNAFGPGTFALYYDAADGRRKPLVITAGSELGMAQIAPGQRHSITAPLPDDLDLLGENPFVLVYRGFIGQEDGVAGRVFEAPDVFPGFVFDTAAPLLDGVAGRRLIYNRGDGWKLHSQGGFMVGSADWKGWYENGQPTRVLSWDGKRYFEPGITVVGSTYYSTESRTGNIYQDGKVFAVAPYGVLGAALQKDAQGKVWVVAITSGRGVDVVFRRPATPSLSSALIDTAPDGWQNIGEFPNPDYLEPIHRDWLFNGSGTEAQTMRERKGRALPWRQPLTRLRITINGATSDFNDLGNTSIIRRTDSSDSGCITTDVRSTSSQTIVGESIIAVDYIDEQPVFARIQVEASRTFGESGQLTGNQNYDTRVSGSESARWLLSIGSGTITLVDDRYARTDHFEDLEGEEYRAATTAEYAYDRTQLASMDLRTGLVVLARGNSRGTSSYTRINANWSQTGSSSKYRQYTIQGAGFSKTSPQVDIVNRSLDGSGDDASTADYTLASECVSSGERRSPWSHQTEREVFVSPETVDMRGIPTGSYSASAASDRNGNHFVSLQYGDTGTNVDRYLNVLSNGDPVALTGIDPSAAHFMAIAPK